jgi:four helix bundle protein
MSRARRTPAEYRNFLNVATASAAETAYMVDVAGRLDLLAAEHAGLRPKA